MEKDSKTQSTVVRLHKNNVVEILEELLEMAKRGELKNFIAAGYLNNGEIVTANVDVNVIEHQTLNSYLQTDVIMKIVEKNNND